MALTLLVLGLIVATVATPIVALKAVQLQATAQQRVVLYETRRTMVAMTKLTHRPFVVFGSSTVWQLRDHFGPHVAHGVKWLRSDQLLGTLRTHGTPVVPADAVVLYIGVNDLMFDDSSPQALADRIVAIMDLLVATATTVHYVPIIESPFQHLRGQLDRIRDVNGRVNAAVATRPRCSVVRLPDDLMALDFGIDLLHLNDHGLGKLRTAILAHLSSTSVGATIN